jgi:hypothetical protein
MMRHCFRLLYLALSILVQHAGEIRDASRVMIPKVIT